MQQWNRMLLYILHSDSTGGDSDFLSYGGSII
jgi:hypothetical protein